MQRPYKRRVRMDFCKRSTDLLMSGIRVCASAGESTSLMRRARPVGSGNSSSRLFADAAYKAVELFIRNRHNVFRLWISA